MHSMPSLRLTRSEAVLPRRAASKPPHGKEQGLRGRWGTAVAPTLTWPRSEKVDPSKRSPSPFVAPRPRRRRSSGRSGSEASLPPSEEVPGLQEAFLRICSSSRMDSRQFDKFCREAGYIDAKFTTADADLLFTTITARGPRRLSSGQFEAALRLLADRKRLSLDSVFSKVKKMAAPSSEGSVERRQELAGVTTLPEAAPRSRAQSSPPSDSRGPASREGWFYPLDNGYLPGVKRHSLGVDKAERELLLDSFVNFCWGKPDMSNRDFLRLCRDCRLLSSRFTALDADLLFVKVLPKGQRRLKFEDFEAALIDAAVRKKVSESDIRRAIAFCHGPFVQATEADTVRLHDDISSYTGTHVHGGPESGGLGAGTVVQMW